MKHLGLQKLIFSFSALLFLLAGCSDFNGGSFSDGKTVDKITLTVSAVNEKGNNVTSSVNKALSRSLLPNVDAYPALTYYISGKSSKGYTLASTELEFSDGISTTTIQLQYDYWNLTLIAKDAGGQTVLTGSIQKDLSNASGTPTLAFKLTSRTCNGYGGVNLPVIFKDEGGIVTKVTAGIYNFTSGLPLENCVVEYTTAGSTKFLPLDNSGDSHFADYNFEFSFIKASVPNGTYTFKVIFYKDDAEGNPQQCGIWTDLLRVDAGNTTSTTNTENVLDDNGKLAIPDVISKKPDAAPENLQVWYIDGSETDINGDIYYKVLVTWDDKSTNEDYFNLKVENISLSETYFDSADAVFAQGSSAYLQGSLLAGNEACILLLPTGYEFEFYLRACNWVGTTPNDNDTPVYVERISSDSVSPVVDDSVYDWFDDSETYAGYDVENGSGDPLYVNRMQITYDLNYGTYNDTAASFTQTGGNILNYYVYDGSDVDIIDIDGTVKTLVYNNHPFNGWYDALTGGTLVTGIAAADANHNTYLYANYLTNYYISFEVEGYGDLAASRVTATYIDSGNPVDVKNGANIILEDQDVTFTVLAADSSSDDENLKLEFKKYRFDIDGRTYYFGTSSSFTMAWATNQALDKLSSGNHVVTVYACVNNTLEPSRTDWYGNSFIIIIQR